MNYNLKLVNRPIYGQTYYPLERISDDSVFSCLSELADYFDLSDEPELITIKISGKRHKNSYFCKVHKEGPQTIKVNLTSNRKGIVHVYDNFYAAIGKFPNGCYVSVIA